MRCVGATMDVAMGLATSMTGVPQTMTLEVYGAVYFRLPFISFYFLCPALPVGVVGM